MDNKVELYSVKNYQYHQEEVRKDLVVINPEPMFFGSSSYVHKIIEEYLGKEMEIVLIGNLIDAYREGNPLVNEKKQIRLVMKDTNECVRAYATAGEIVTFGELPEYYIKREEQRVRLFTNERRIGDFSYKKKSEFWFKQAVRLADEIQIIGEKQMYELMQEKKKEGKEKKTLLVFFSANSYMFANKLMNMVEFDKKFRGLASANGLTIRYFLPVGIWDKIDTLGYLMKQEYVIPATADLCDELAEAALLVTNSTGAMKLSAMLGLPCVYAVNSLRDHHPKGIRYGYDKSGMYSELTAAILEHANKETIPVSVPETEIPETDVDLNLKKKLMLLDWTDLRDYRGMLKNWKQNARRKGEVLTVLLRSSRDGQVYQCFEDLYSDLELQVRAGYYIATPEIRQLIDEEEYKEDQAEKTAYCMKMEWRRILGMDNWQEALLAQHKDAFWKYMNEFAPADQTKVVERQDIYKELYEYFEPSELAAEKQNPEILKECTVDGSSYRYLGQRRNRSYFIESAAVKEPYILCVYDGNAKALCKGEAEEAALEQKPVIICNLTRNDRILDGIEKNAWEIFVPALPVSLLLKAEKFISGTDGECSLLASYLGLPISTPKNMTYTGIPASEKMKICADELWNDCIIDENMKW